MLDFADTSEYDNAVRGLIDAPEVLELTDAEGNVIWSQAAYSFLDDYEQAPDTVNPSLWENTRNNHAYGLFEVCPGIYQVRGYDMANLTVIKGDELKEIALETKCKLHYSHAIFVGRRSFKDKAEFLQIMNGLREAGVDAMFDIYNELLGVSVITVILPAWYQAMSIEERRKPLNRLKLTVLVYATSLLLGFGFKDIQVAYIGKGFEKYEGKSVHDIAKAEGMSDLDAYLMLCEKSDYKGRVNMGPYTTPEIISDFEHNENCLYMTDAWVEEFGVQNPAIYDCFPKFLRDALTGTGDTLENTIRRMTGATADRFKLSDRGYIRPGCFADLTVFDEKEIRAAQPEQEKPFGIRQVFINGKQVLSEGTLDKDALKTTGRAIRVG